VLDHEDPSILGPAPVTPAGVSVTLGTDIIPVAPARSLSSQAFDFIKEGEDRSRPVSGPREAFFGLANPLVVLARELARRRWFDSGSRLRDQLGKRSDVSIRISLRTWRRR
jgi:hypothetical protein